MLVNPGDLIPVLPTATALPWTRRKSQILNYLHRGPVTFSTLVYDTNVGDISAISTYFNPERVSIKDLNSRFGHYPVPGTLSGDVVQDSSGQNVLAVRPRLLLYPEHGLNQKQASVHSAQQASVQRTLKWVLSQDGKESSGSSPTPRDDMGMSPLVPSEIPAVSLSPRFNPARDFNCPRDLPPSARDFSATAPASLATQLDSVWGAVAPNSLATQLDNVWGVVGQGRNRTGEDRGRIGSRGSSDVSRSRGSSQDVNRAGGEDLIPRWDLGDATNDHKTWATWDNNRLFDSLLKFSPQL